MLLITAINGGAAGAHAAQPEPALYVAPGGSDRNSGAKNRPLRTLQTAQIKARKQRAAGQSVRVVLRGGNYYLPDGLIFTAADSDTLWSSAPGETARLIGGAPVTGAPINGWNRGKGGIRRATLPPTVHVPNQLFENGQRLTLARTPNAGYAEITRAVTAKTQFVYPENLLPAGLPAQSRFARVFLWPGENWFSVDKPITRIDAETRTITMRGDDGYDMKPGNRFFVYNSLPLLDQRGEAVIQGRDLFVWPRGSKIGTVVAATALTLVRIRGAKNLWLENLDLSISAGDVVRFEQSASGGGLRACRVENGQECGVKAEGAVTDLTIMGCEIRENGWHGVSLNGPPPGQPNTNHGHVIENCWIHHNGRLVGHGYGVEINQSGNNRITHCEISDVPRYGVSIKGVRLHALQEQLPQVTFANQYEFLHSNHNTIAFNDIHHTNQDSQDTGAIESWGGGRDNVIDHNHIHHSGNQAFNLQSGIYLDDAANYFTITNNIIHDVQGTGGDQPVFAKGVGNRFENNILIAAPGNSSAIRSFAMAEEATREHSYRRNIIVFEPARPEDSPVPKSGFGDAAFDLHPPGKTLSWNIAIPETGDYDFWMRYAADNTGDASPMDNRTTLRVDNDAPAPLTHLPNTGEWGNYQWSKEPSARLHLTKGKHTLTWRNEQGGGLNWDAFALIPGGDFPAAGTTETTVPKNAIVVQTETAAEWIAARQAVDAGRAAYWFQNWSADRIRAADHNLFWAPGKEIGFRVGDESRNLAAWQQTGGEKFDVHSMIADPQFVDRARGDFRLKPTSPVWKLGFQPINRRQIGLRPDFPRRFQPVAKTTREKTK